MTVHPGIGPRPQARVRSFTRRGVRVPANHQAAYDRLGPQLVVPVPRRSPADSTSVHPAYRMDPAAVFGRVAPLVVEVGSGCGEAVLAGAMSRPQWDFLALEVWRPGVAESLARVADRPPANLRFAEVDAEGLGTMVGPGAVHELWTFFPDPWPKTKHHKRRLVRPGFAATVCRVLQPGGLWRLATDWAHYAKAIRAELAAERRLELVSTERAPLRPVTRFERKGLAAGRPIDDLCYRRL